MGKFWRNKNYEIDVRDGTITCWYRHEPRVTITTTDASGTKKEVRAFSEVFKGAPILPYFTADYCPVLKMFDVDLDCGAQRWRGYRSIVDVKKALRKCGMSYKTAAIFTDMAIETKTKGAFDAD